MGGETERAKERVGDRVRERAAGWVWGTWPVNERSLLPLSASSFSHCLPSLVGLTAEEGPRLDTPPSPSLPSVLYFPPLSIYLSLRALSPFPGLTSPLFLLSPSSPPCFPLQDVVWGGSAPQREAAGLGGKSKLCVFVLSLSLDVSLTFCLFVLPYVCLSWPPDLTLTSSLSVIHSAVSHPTVWHLRVPQTLLVCLFH